MPSDRTDLAAVRARVEAEMQSAWPYAMAGVGAVPTHEFIADIRALLAALDAAEAERDRLVKAVNWACGILDDFEEPPNAKRYWWRTGLHERAGLVYDPRIPAFVLPLATPTETPDAG